IQCLQRGLVKPFLRLLIQRFYLPEKDFALFRFKYILCIRFHREGIDIAYGTLRLGVNGPEGIYFVIKEFNTYELLRHMDIDDITTYGKFPEMDRLVHPFVAQAHQVFYEPVIVQDGADLYRLLVA